VAGIYPNPYLMPEDRPSGDVTYHGLRRESGVSVIVIENAVGEPVGIVPHLIKHSPTGMNWGYSGSGPADTARSLLIEAMGSAAICPACGGTSRVVYVGAGGSDEPVPEPFDRDRHRWTKQGWQCECDGGYKRLPYPDFTEQFVSKWGTEWLMTRADILEWLSISHEY
jgi:hypothetical protein